MDYKVYSMDFAGRKLTLEFGKYAQQAGGSVIVRYGETVVLVTATASEAPREGTDFFPLSVDFEEKQYSVGKIPGGFIKREGRPTEKATLTCRLIDRPLRPLFNKGMRNDVQVVVTTLSVEPDVPPDISRGTIEGDIAPSGVTVFRIQSTADAVLRAYVADGEILPVATRSFGSIGVIGIREMARFYRHVLVGKHFPHHGAVAFGHYGKALFEVFKYLGVKDIAYNQPASIPYPSENPWK